MKLCLPSEVLYIRFWLQKDVFGFLSSSLVNLAYDASMLLVTFFGFRGCLGAFASVSVVFFLNFATLVLR